MAEELQELKEESPTRWANQPRETPSKRREGGKAAVSLQGIPPTPQTIPAELKEPEPIVLPQSSPSPLLFRPNLLDSPSAIPRLLKTLSTTEDLKQINGALLALIKKGKFADVAEWFVENQDTLKARILRRKLASQPPNYKKGWYKVMKDPSLYGGSTPLKPHVMENATLKGFKELHPFELLLGEYCRLKRNDPHRDEGLFYILFWLDKAVTSAADTDPRDLLEKLGTLSNFLEEKHRLRDVIDDISELLLTPNMSTIQFRAAADIDFKKIGTLLSTEATRYRKKYDDYLTCGFPVNLLLLDDLLADAVVDLENNPTLYGRDRAHTLFQQVRLACEHNPSSVTYFYYSLICKTLALHFETLSTESADDMDPIWKRFYLQEMIYGAILSAHLFEYDQKSIVQNAFQGEGFKESRFLKSLPESADANIQLTPPLLKQKLFSQFPEAGYLSIYKIASQKAEQFIAHNFQRGETEGAGLSNMVRR